MCLFFLGGAPVKTLVENGLIKIFCLRFQTIDVSYQAVFTLKDSVIHDEYGKKTNVIDPIIVVQRQSVHFLFLMMVVHPDQSDPICKHIRMTCRACVQIPLGLDGIETSIDT